MSEIISSDMFSFPENLAGRSFTIELAGREFPIVYSRYSRATVAEKVECSNQFGGSLKITAVEAGHPVVDFYPTVHIIRLRVFPEEENKK